jgi:hypothetical protein
MRGVDLVAVGRRFDSLLLRISADGIDESRMSPGVGVGSGQFKGFICVCVCPTPTPCLLRFADFYRPQ